MASLFQPGMMLFERFTLLRFIYAGGQAEIWEVSDREYARVLALKLRYVEWERRDDHAFVQRNERLKQEEELLAGITSRYVIRPHDRPQGQYTDEATS
jgi:hypothetical protein